MAPPLPPLWARFGGPTRGIALQICRNRVFTETIPPDVEHDALAHFFEYGSSLAEHWAGAE